METINAEVVKITFRNESNYYTVAVLKNGTEEFIGVGTMPFLNEGDCADFTGEFIVHQTYGEQFKVESFDKKPPKNSAAILKYLSSGAIKGVGPSTAGRIVEKFGEQSLDIIQNSPESLASIKGISLNKAMAIGEEYAKQYGIRDIMLMLSKFNITPDRCVPIYKRYGQKSIESIKANPYLLCQDGIDFGFPLVEDIANDFGFDMSSETRISAGIEYVLRKNLYNGHTCLPRNKFVPVACNLLGCNESVVEACCDNLLATFSLCSKEIDGVEYLSIPSYFNAEQYIAARLISVKDFINSKIAVDELEIKAAENSLGIRFEALQRQAISETFKNGILVLTGGPGTGKTTTLNAIIKLFQSRDMIIELAAPTGRAAKRMTELTGREAKTIHRLLEVEWVEGDKQQFCRNEKNPLDCDVIIIDEASMIDAILFENLLKALRLNCRIILVGDSDQLPSIGAGNVLGDILAANIFPSIKLKKVFRQANESMIVRNAHAIINGQKADFNNKKSDCFFLERQDKYSAVETVLSLVTERLPTAYNFDPITDIQVLCPSRLLDTGANNLNNLLQEQLNPRVKNSPQLAYKGVYFRIGDKVMQIKNNYDIEYKKDDGTYGRGAFNGDMGCITEIDNRAGIMKVRFEDRVVTYFNEDFNQLELAYAVTVHKSQGSEYPCVIVPLFDVPSKLMYRNLLYTAVTRAKELLVLVGSKAVWDKMAENNRKTLRYTLLSAFLKENLIDESF
ncbi:MAG: ATP-dependent RecD-like DNA helicase [Clostridia bacterium]|nr:ATP-dependent RecD-like DNA helicase [Clostridia bacterium]